MPNDVSDEDKALFRAAVKTTRPLKKSNTIEPEPKITQRKSPPSSKSVGQKSPLKASLTQDSIYLSNYYTEEVQTQSILSFCRPDIPIKRLQELRQGKIPWQAKLDLHGYKAETAAQILVDFILQELAQDHRCLLIIHGKGSHRGEPPILKNLVNHWLKQISSVLAFHSALPREGGAGALYVLLKRNR
ncbi:Smr/MutS family protein [Legionella sp. D16C41]|uniref:Smr/MutS family protein n=1 Tax=Legionella sp. D16C41 TaxID=3402688 RepID=UPI003AF94129